MRRERERRGVMRDDSNGGARKAKNDCGRGIDQSGLGVVLGVR